MLLNQIYTYTRLGAVFALFLLAFSAPASAQTDTIYPAPETWGDQFVAALRSTSSAEQTAIARQIFAPATLANPGTERLLGLFNRLQQEMSPIEYHHSEVFVAELSPGDVRRVLHIYLRKEGASMWRDIQMRLDPEPPYKLATIAFIAEVAEPVSLPNSDITQQITLDWLDGYVQKLVRENDLSGSILIAKGDQILFERYFGFADDAKTRAVDEHTLFNLGSGNKMFTALAIAKLQEEGKLQFTDRLIDFFPDFPNPELARKVTIHHLLSHSSGVGEYWTEKTETVMRQAESWHEYLPMVYQAGFNFEPGTEAGYSNSNFILLGAILEQVTGLDYFYLIQTLVYDKAGMAESGSFPFDRDAQRLAMPLTRNGDAGWVMAKHGKRGSPAGGGYSNLRDMLRFSKGLKTAAFVSAETLNNMITLKTAGLIDAFPYGYGFIPEKNDGVRSYGHGGIAPGVNLEFRYFPAADITLVVFSNQDNGAFDDLKKNTIKLITGER